MTRTEFLNMLIKMHGFTSYLEIGMQKSANNFDKITARRKISIDPDPAAGATFCCTSDYFFNTPHHHILNINESVTDDTLEYTRQIVLEKMAEIGKQVLIPQNRNTKSDDVPKKFDIIFIDGSHIAGDVEKDIIGAIQMLNYKGFIILHDCNPPTEKDQLVPRQHKVWYGDVWRAFVGFRLKYPGVTSFCLNHDCGLGVIKYTDQKIEPGFVTNMSWNEFDKSRKQLLGII